ncbi:hypothetical protein H4Q26_001447 [Puccinia striiformis f. sp. tritici PST-130]|nr:hypothetical protein H4Q26_001447 [Puccinia striiformis f. sp. tritici PST-130]
MAPLPLHEAQRGSAAGPAHATCSAERGVVYVAQQQYTPSGLPRTALPPIPTHGPSPNQSADPYLKSNRHQRHYNQPTFHLGPDSPLQTGFIQTHTDSRRALEAPPASPLDAHSADGPRSTRSQGAQPEKAQPKPKGPKSTKSSSQSTDQVIDVKSAIDIVQDSDDENAKAETDSKVDHDEFDNIKLHYHEPYKADDQVKPGALTYKCRWCPKSVRVNGSTDSNLKTHRNGAINQNRGANLPISSDDKAAAKEKKAVPTGTLTAYVTKGKFDINTLNRILLFWIIRQSLPWARFGDYLLGVAFDFSNAHAKVFSRTWAAFNARKLYMSLQFKVVSDIKLKQPLEAPKSVPDYFPTLEAIAEVDENEEGPHNKIEILQLDDGDDIEEVDPDDAEYVEESAPGYFADPSDGNVPTGGIGYTLLKVDYICRRVSSSSARRADFKLVAVDKKHKGSLIPGYGIRWNVAYDCWQRAYAARRVIDQLLEDETDKFAGKLAAGHFYKGYKISKKEWENVNSVTIVLEEFLALTLSMEEDRPNASMVLYKYRQLIDSLEKKKIAPEFAALQVMFDPMIKVAKKYLDIALGCTPILLATIVHPAWRMSLIKDKFPEYEDIALSLVQAAFKAKQEAHNQMLPEPAVPDSNAKDSDEEEFNYYPVKNGSSQDTNKLKRYLDGAYPLGKKGDPLNWWMSVIDTASANPKFATQVANENKKIKAKKIKHVANPETKSK